MIVADTGPLIAFLQISRLDLLQQIVVSLFIPDAVYEELVLQGQGAARATEIAQNPWIQRKSVTNREALTLFPAPLHAGEREAIVLAQELDAQLLIDERRGRRHARERGIEVIGSLRILAEAKRLGFITAVKPLLESMRATGYWIEQRLIAFFLQEVGESES